MRVLVSIAVRTICAAAVAASAADDKPAAQPVQLAWPSLSRALRLVAAIPPAEGEPSPVAGDPLRLVNPLGVVVDGAGRVFVADPGHRALVVYQPDTGESAQWKGAVGHPLLGPVAVAADREGRIFAVDGYQARVVVFDTAGTPVADFGEGLLKRPVCIGIDSAAGRIYVGDVKLQQICVFSLRTLKMEKTIDGSPAMRFDSLAQMTVNSKGLLLVSDGWRCGLYIFDSGGALVREFPTQCGRRGEFGRPYAIAVDAKDRVYVANPDDDSLQIFDHDGKPLQLVRSLGKSVKPPAVRTGIAMDRKGRVYVIDRKSGAGRLRIFAQSGEPGRPSAPPSRDRGAR